MKNRFKQIKISKKYQTIAALVAIVLIGLVWWMIYWPVNFSVQTDIEVLIIEGQSLRQIAVFLKDKGLIRSSGLFNVYVTALGEDESLKAGRYLFSKSMSMHDIVAALAQGLSEADDMEITIPEGSNIWEIDKILSMRGLITESQLAKLYYKDEGYLFPDTYRITDDQQLTTNNLSDKIVRELREKMGRGFADKAGSILAGKSSKEQKEILIIASMLEKEAKTEADMRLVSGIIRKRMALGMLLQIDATVAYGACLRITNYELRITNKNCDVTLVGVANEIKIDGAYNTYTRKGLPLGPISNPGLKAINAAINPQKSDYLYYLSTRDGSRLIYSKTSSEHEINRRKYLGI